MSHDVERLQISQDYGTKTLSMAYHIAKPGEKDNLAGKDIRPVTFDHNTNELSQRVAYSDEGQFYLGDAVNQAIRAKQISLRNVFKNWKLCLYNDYEKSDAVVDIESRLANLNKTPADLIFDHQKSILTIALSKIKGKLPRTPNADKFDTLPKQLFISVPQMWKRPANRIMTEAAKAAGVDSVKLVYEPECAAAFAMKRMFPDKEFDAGDCMVVADLGGGTADFVSYQFGQRSGAGAATDLGTIGQSKGALCGAEFVNLNFCQQVREIAAREAGSFEAKCAELGLTEHEVMDIASERFEGCKISTGGSPDDWLTQYVYITGPSEAGQRHWGIAVTPEIMQKCFDKVIAQIEGCIDDQLKRANGAKLLLVTGKFGRSKYLMSQLNLRYHQSRDYPDLEVYQECEDGFYPVSFGALMRFGSVKDRGWDRAEQLLIAREERYNPTDHPDATLNLRHGGPDRNIVRAGHFGENYGVVDGRAAAIFAKDDGGRAHHPVVWEYRMLPVDKNGIVPLEDADVALQTYWTEKPMNDHEPMLVGGYGSDLRPAIEKWGAPIIFTIPHDLKALGFHILKKRVSDGNGWVWKRFVKVFFSINVHEDGPNLSVSIRLVDPKVQEPYLLDDQNVPFIDDHNATIFETAYSPTPCRELQFTVVEEQRGERRRDRAAKRQRTNGGEYRAAKRQRTKGGQ